MTVCFWSSYYVQYLLLSIVETARKAGGASATRTFPVSREINQAHTKLEYNTVVISAIQVIQMTRRECPGISKTKGI